jgi:hypothetical protein
MAASAQTDREGDDRKGEGKPSRDVTKFLKDCVKKFNRAEAAEQKNRQAALEDLKFKNGEQWPDAIKADRTMQKRPCLTINKMKTFVHQITNDQRQNRPAIGVSPVGDRADPETAKMLKGLIRQIERQSNADVAYDTGFDSAVSIGWGYWRILTEYEDEDSFDQVIRIMRIRNTFRIYVDPDSHEPDGSDMKWCFISDLLTRSEYDDMFPGKEVSPWEEGTIGDEYKSWSTNTHVRIAEYFYFDDEERELLALSTGHIGYEDELADDVREAIELDPSLIVNTRKVMQKKIKWCKISSKDILDEQDWPGKWIPVIKVIGDEVDIEGKSNLAGIIRDAKDPQRMYNYWRTAETELIALAPKAPWIMEEGQVEGHEVRWRDANTKSFPYLLYKGVNIAGKPAPPPQRQPFAGSPDGVTKAAIAAAQDIQATTGIRFDATLQERMYDESGKALRELKRVGDLGNFHYVDNLSRSLRHTGRILIDLIPKIYDTPRVITILREDDSEERIKIDPSLGSPHGQTQGQDGKVQRLYNPKLGEYEVAVTIGPSYATKRAEAADSMLGFMKAVPQAGPLIGDLIAKNMDWPGAEEISTRLAAMLPPQLQGKDMQNFPPEARGMLMSLQHQLKELGGQHQKALAMLGDKEADRDIQRDKIEKDFEAKLTKIAADMAKEMLGAMESKMTEIADVVKQVEQMFKQGEMERKISAAKESAEKAKPREPGQKMPDFHIHLPSGKKKISKGADGSYTSEDA